MKKILLKLLFVVQLILLAGEVMGQEVLPEDGWDPGLGIMLLLMMAVVVILIGVGLAIGGVLILLISTAVSFGVITYSIIIGVKNKSVKSGFKALTILGSAAIGIPLGILITFVFQYKDLTNPTFLRTVIPGSIAGLIAGSIIGLLFFRGICYIIELTRLRLERNTSPPTQCSRERQ